MSNKIISCVLEAYADPTSHQYVCQESNGKLVVCSKATMGSRRRLPLNELISRLEGIWRQTPHAEQQGLSDALKLMADRKFDKAYKGKCICKIFTALRLFFSKLQNALCGFGFQTSVMRARTLASKVEESAAVSEPAPLVRQPSAGRASRPSVGAPVASPMPMPTSSTPYTLRPYRKDPADRRSPLVPVRILSGDVTGEYLKAYNSRASATDCSAVSGPFTYYNAHLTSDAIPSDQDGYFADDEWGHGWRGVLNQCNKLREHLAARHGIQPEGNYDREWGMHDIHELTQLDIFGKLESVDAAELFYRFVDKAYSSDDREEILKLFAPRGFLYLSSSKTYNDWLPDAIFRQVQHANCVSTSEPYRLIKMASLLWNKSEAAINMMGSSTDRELSAKWAEFNRDFASSFPLAKDKLTAWIAFLALTKLYPKAQSKSNRNILASEFPKLNEATHPIPFIVDDSDKTRNIYGYRVTGTEVTDLFAGDVQVGFGTTAENPWLAAGWIPTTDVTDRRRRSGLSMGFLAMVGILPTNDP